LVRGKKPDEVETHNLILPLNAQKKALLKTKNGTGLVITIVDEFNRIAVEE